MSPEQEKYFQENFNDYDKSTKTDSFLNMFILQPMMDNWANNGIAKSASFHLEKALMTSNANINYLNSHALGSRFGVGILNKIPIIKNIFPDKTTKIWDNGVMGKIFKNTDFFYQTKLDKQVSEGVIEDQYVYDAAVGKKAQRVKVNELKKAADKAGMQVDGEIVGHNISWSNKKTNDAVRKLKTLGINGEDFSKGKMFLEVDGEKQLVDFTRENMDKLITSKVTNEQALRASTTVGEVMSNLKAPAEIKNMVKGQINEYLETTLEELKSNKTVAGFIQSHSKDGKLILDGEVVEEAARVIGNARGGSTKTVLKEVADIAMDNATKITDVEKGQLLDTVMKKNIFEKFFSTPFGKVITQVGTGKVAFGLNIAGSIIGGVASHMQDNAVQNFAKTIVDYQLNSGKDVYESNEATMHSIQTHMQRSGDDLEEYKKQLYYRNFSNDMRRDMSRLDNEYLSADKIQTS